MTADWTQGYITDTIYTESFFQELSPAWLNYVAALKGCLPVPLDRPFTYLELGCGLGRSTTVLAGAFPGARFIGVDFNPAHIALAQRYASTLDVQNVEFLEASFTEIQKGQLPPCDFIVLHGVYSWVNAEARAGIRRIIKDHLKPGGLVYISYNALPGWAAASPLRKLMVEAAAQSGNDTTSSVSAAIELMEEASTGNSAFFKVNSGATRELKNLKARGSNYLAHEFLNAEWSLFYSVDVADELAEAKLSYLGSATLSENHIELLVDEATATQIQSQKSFRLRQLLLDYAINQRFRRDVFVRGHQELPEAARDSIFSNILLGSAKPDDEFTIKAKVGNREVMFAEKLFPAVQQAIASGPKTVAELRQACAAVTQRRTNVDNLLTTLVAVGHLSPFSQTGGFPSVGGAETLEPVNETIIQNVLSSKTTQHLISKKAGSGVSIDPVEAILLRLVLSGKAEKELAKGLPAALLTHGLRLAENLKKEEGEADASVNSIDRFLSKKLPVLRRLVVHAEG